MDHEAIELHKRPTVEQEVKTLACGQFAFRVLCLESLGAAAELRFPNAALELLELLAHSHRPEIVVRACGNEKRPRLPRPETHRTMGFRDPRGANGTNAANATVRPTTLFLLTRTRSRAPYAVEWIAQMRGIHVYHL